MGRSADGCEGARCRRGLARHARVDALQGQHRRPHRHRSRAAARRGRSARRAHDVAGVRVGELDAHLHPRRDPQSVEPGAHARRIVGRLGRRGRGRHDADLHGERRRWIDPHPVVVQRAVRFQGQLRPGRRLRELRLRTHVGSRTDVPLGARRGPLRRRDRGPDRRRSDFVAEAAVVRGSPAVGRGRRAPARAARRVVVDTRLRGVRPRSRKAGARGGDRALRRRGHRTGRRRLPPPASRAGVEPPVEHRCFRQPSRGIPTEPRRRRDAGLARRFRADRTHHRRAGVACGTEALGCAPRHRRRLRPGRPDPHADHGHHGIRGGRAAAIRDRGPARRRHGLGSLYGPVQHLGHAGREHSRRDQRRRLADGVAGRGPPSRGRARPGLRRDRRSRSAPGPSSPPAHTYRSGSRTIPGRTRGVGIDVCSPVGSRSPLPPARFAHGPRARAGWIPCRA